MYCGEVRDSGEGKVGRPTECIAAEQIYCRVQTATEQVESKCCRCTSEWFGVYIFYLVYFTAIVGTIFVCCGS